MLASGRKSPSYEASIKTRAVNCLPSSVVSAAMCVAFDLLSAAIWREEGKDGGCKTRRFHLCVGVDRDVGLVQQRLEDGLGNMRLQVPLRRDLAVVAAVGHKELARQPANHRLVAWWSQRGSSILQRTD